MDFCRSALTQCSLLQHPAVEPLPPLTSIEDSLVAAATAPPIPPVQPSHYQLRDGTHSRSITPLPMQDIQSQDQREVSPILMETLPSVQPPSSSSAKLLPSAPTTVQTHKEDRTRMEIDLTKEEEDSDHDTKPQINLISTSASENFGQSSASRPTTHLAATEGDRNILVAKNVTTSSSSSLPATSTSSLHHPSVQVVSSTGTKGKKDFSDDIMHAQATTSGAVAAAKKDNDDLNPFGISDSDSDTSGLEFFVDKSPDREKLD